MREFWSKLIVSIALGAGMVWLAFRGEDWSSFGERLNQVQMVPLLGYIGFFALAHILRILRWGLMVRALGGISWREIISAGAVGYMCITVFPLRLGEFVRPYLVRGKQGVTASGAMATVVVERVFDGVLFVGMFFFFISMLPPKQSPAISALHLAAYGAGVFFLSLLFVLIIACIKRKQTLKFISWVGSFIHSGFTHKIVELLEGFLDGLRVFPDIRRLGLFLLITAIYWILQGVAIKLMAISCHIPDMSLLEAFALLTVLVVGIMVPAGPGYTGSFELAVKTSFALFVISPESQANITVFIVMLHLSQVVVQVGFGLVFMALDHIGVKKLVRQ